MSTNYHIIFNGKPEGIIYSGEELSGRVDITTDIPQNIQGIHLLLNGYSKVAWSGKAYYNEYTGNITRNGNFTDRIQHLIEKIQLLNNAEHADFSPGHYSFPFHFTLPHSLPTSFHDKYGETRYDLIVEILRTDSTTDIYKKGLTIIKPLDLHLHPSCMEPWQKDDEVDVGCGCCLCFCFRFCLPRGFIIGSLKTPATGYLSGQKVPFTVVIKNQTTHNAEVTVRLLTKIKYTCHEPFNESLEQEQEIILKNLGIAEASKMVELGDSIEIPPLAPSSVNTSPLINVTYLLVLRAKVPYSPVFLIQIPLIIGTPCEEKHSDADGLVFKPKEKTTIQKFYENNIHGDGDGPVLNDTTFSTCNDAINTAERNSTTINRSIHKVPSTFEPLYPVVHGRSS